MIRPAKPRDVTQMIAIRLAATENTASQSRLQELGLSEALLAKKLQTTYRSFVAEVDQSIVGFSMIDPAANELFALFVSADAEGQGIGSALLSEAVDAARANGIVELTLETDRNSRAFAFYRSRGWFTDAINTDGQARMSLHIESNPKPSEHASDC